MELSAAWGLIGALLVLGVQGDVPTGELTQTQNKAIQLVMEKFHQRDLPNGYKMTSVLKAADELYLAGIFVNVEFLVKQTSCRKNDWSKSNCQAIKQAKTYNCFGCFKLEYDTHSIISRVEECIVLRHLNADRKTRRNNLCKEVEMKGSGKTNVGKYSFLKSD